MIFNIITNVPAGWRLFLLLSSIGIVSSLITSCAENSIARDHRQELIQTREAWNESIKDGDLNKIFSFWTDDAVIYPVSAPAVEGKDAIREYVRKNRQELGIRPRVNPEEYIASSSGDLGFVLGTFEWIDSTGQVIDPGRYVSMWRKNEKDEWKCFMEFHNPRPE